MSLPITRSLRNSSAWTYAAEAAAAKPETGGIRRRRRRAESRGDRRPPGLIAQRWVTTTAFHYDVGFPGSGDRHVAGQGYEFDGASVPFPLTDFVPQTHSLYLGAAALHHWLYQIDYQTVARERADAIFREAMIDDRPRAQLDPGGADVVGGAGRRLGGLVQPPARNLHLAYSPAAVDSPRFADLDSHRHPRAVGALVIELLSLKTYRAEAARIRALDAPE